MRSTALWLAGASAASIVAATTAAAAGPLGHQRLAAALGGSAVASQPLSASLAAASTPSLGRRRGNPGTAPAPVAKVTLTEASSGQAIVVKPGTEIDVTLKPDAHQRWAPPRSDRPQTVSSGRGGWGWGGPGGRQSSPDLGPGQGKGDGSTHAVFFAHRAGDATLSSAERGGGGLLLLRPPTKGKTWSVKVTVSGPAPAAPTHAAPAAVEPAAQAAPSARTVDVSRLVTPVAPTVQRLPVTLPRF